MIRYAAFEGGEFEPQQQASKQSRSTSAESNRSIIAAASKQVDDDGSVSNHSVNLN